MEASMSKNSLSMIKEHDVKWIDLRFTDARGKEQHVTIPATSVDEEFFENGQMFDGSSVGG
jgi:glutamine synthetase